MSEEKPDPVAISEYMTEQFLGGVQENFCCLVGMQTLARVCGESPTPEQCKDVLVNHPSLPEDVDAVVAAFENFTAEAVAAGPKRPRKETEIIASTEIREKILAILNGRMIDIMYVWAGEAALARLDFPDVNSVEITEEDLKAVMAEFERGMTEEPII